MNLFQEGVCKSLIHSHTKTKTKKRPECAFQRVVFPTFLFFPSKQRRFTTTTVNKKGVILLAFISKIYKEFVLNSFHSFSSIQNQVI